ncbi:DNA polymerase [Deltaproteobacteria bacterium]|nr:DNA polymerase [Deltaproteobacteria bacterium]
MDLLDLSTAQFVPPVERRPWMDDVIMERVTAQSLDRVIDEMIAAKLYALDLETSGLDNRNYQGKTVKDIVGICVSAAPFTTGYYIPMRHKAGAEHNVPPRLVEAAMRRLEAADTVAIFHGGKFDHEFLQFNGGEPMGLWDDPNKWEDTLIEMYCINTRERDKRLKTLAKKYLGMEMIALRELFPKDHKGGLDFSLVDPSDDGPVWYGCSDAICTGRLHLLFHPQITNPDGSLLPAMEYQNGPGHGKGMATIYKIEKLCVPATRWMERARLKIDRVVLEELIRLGQQEFFDSLGEVFDGASELLGRKVTPNWYDLMRDTFTDDPSYPVMTQIAEAKALAKARHPDPTGKITKSVPKLTNKKEMEDVAFLPVYDILSAQKLGLMMRELGVQGLKVTEKSGQVKTSKDVLDEVIDSAGAKFPFMVKVKRFRETQKALSSNLLPLHDALDRKKTWDDTIRISFNAHKVDTGRFSTPANKKPEWTGQVKWNFHSIPATYDPNKPECMRRIRECIIARPGRTLFAIDYSGVELRIVTNIAREQKWLEEFFHCAMCDHRFDKKDAEGRVLRPPPFCPKCGSDKIGDLHTLTGISLYGADALNDDDWKQKRQNAKGSNFALCYGGGGNAVTRSTGVNKQEGWRIKNLFDKTYGGLRAWWRKQHAFARQHGYVLTAFGRRYPQPDINHENGFFRSKSERNSVNGPVQGGSADIMKFAMALIYRACKERGWLEKVWMTGTIHDELLFEISDDIVEEAIEVITDIMVNQTTKNLRWPIPLTVDIEMGLNWTVPRNLTEMTWNKAKPTKSWDARWIRLFPKRYAHYLSVGGKPVDGVEAPVIAPEPVAPVEEEALDEPPSAVVEAAQQARAAAQEEPAPVEQPRELPPTATLSRGAPYVHRISSLQMQVGLIERLAMVVHKSIGRGTHPLRIEVMETGEVVWDSEVLIDPTTFSVLAREHGV